MRRHNRALVAFIVTALIGTGALCPGRCLAALEASGERHHCHQDADRPATPRAADLCCAALVAIEGQGELVLAPERLLVELHVVPAPVLFPSAVARAMPHVRDGRPPPGPPPYLRTHALLI